MLCLDSASVEFYLKVLTILRSTLSASKLSHCNRLWDHNIFRLWARLSESFRKSEKYNQDTRTIPFTSAKCKSGTTVLLVHHPAPWSPWSPWSTLIHLGPHFSDCGYTQWTKQNRGGPGMVQGHRQPHGAGWWPWSIQDSHGSLKNIFLMYFAYFVLVISHISSKRTQFLS